MDSWIVGAAIDLAALLAVAACCLTVIGGLLTAFGRHALHRAAAVAVSGCALAILTGLGLWIVTPVQMPGLSHTPSGAPVISSRQRMGSPPETAFDDALAREISPKFGQMTPWLIACRDASRSRVAQVGACSVAVTAIATLVLVKGRRPQPAERSRVMV